MINYIDNGSHFSIRKLGKGQIGGQNYMSQVPKLSKEKSPARAGIAGCLVVVGISVLGIAFITLLGPSLPPLIPWGSIVDFLSGFGIWGSIAIGLILYFWTKGRGK